MTLSLYQLIRKCVLFTSERQQDPQSDVLSALTCTVLVRYKHLEFFHSTQQTCFTLRCMIVTMIPPSSFLLSVIHWIGGFQLSITTIRRRIGRAIEDSLGRSISTFGINFTLSVHDLVNIMDISPSGSTMNATCKDLAVASVEGAKGSGLDLYFNYQYYLEGIP